MKITQVKYGSLEDFRKYVFLILLLDRVGHEMSLAWSFAHEWGWSVGMSLPESMEEMP